MISLTAALNVVLILIIAGLCFWLIYWLIGRVNPPEPFRKVAEVVLAVVAVLFIIGLLLSLIGGAPLIRP